MGGTLHGGRLTGHEKCWDPVRGYVIVPKGDPGKEQKPKTYSHTWMSQEVCKWLVRGL